MSLKSNDGKKLKHTKITSAPAASTLSRAINSIQNTAADADKNARNLATKIEKDQNVYYWYAVLDSLSSSYSMYKYSVDVFIPGNDPNTMHDILMTPEGIAIAVVESLFLSAYAYFATKFDSEKEDNFKKAIATSWPYMRDLIKALKNAYKGWRSCIFVVHLLASVDINYLIAPIGVILGILAAVNRLWLRRMVEERKDKMIANVELRKKIKEAPFSEDKAKYYLSQIQYQLVKTRALAYTAASANGLIDGLYLYAGVLSITILAPSTFIALLSVCSVYVVACIVNRLYEEYEFQMRLLLTQTKCTFEIVAQQLKFAYSRLLALEKLEQKDETILAEIHYLKLKVANLLDDFSNNRELQRKQSNRTYGIAFLFGLKNGLYAYNALSSIIFFFVAVFLIAGCTFPAPLLLSIIAIGVAITTFFIVHSLVAHHQHAKAESKKTNEYYAQLINLKIELKSGKVNKFLSEEAFNKSLQKSLSVDASPTYFFQEWFEVVRSLFSGFSKGQKFIDFAGNSFQEVGANGVYHDGSGLRIMGIASGVMYSLVLGMRALGKGFGRVPLGAEDKSKKVNKELTPAAQAKPLSPELATQNKAPSPQASPLSKNYSRGGFFSTTKKNDMPPQDLNFRAAGLSI